MRQHNAENEVVKREYLAWLRNAGGRSEATIDQAAAAIHRFEAFNRYKTFKAFRWEQAVSFKAHLAAQVNATTGKPLSKSTIYSTLKTLRAFFEWLSREPGYRSTVAHSDAAYFNPTENDARIATARRERMAPSIEQVRAIVEAMPTETALERRDRAVVALIMLTGARDAAVASLKLKHLDLNARTLLQDPREVATKRAKTIKTTFFPVGEPFEAVVRAWAEELTNEHLFGPDDPLFPATRMGTDGAGLFAPAGPDRRPWANSGPIREVFKKACARAGLPYFNPHSLRNTLVHFAYSLNLGGRELKAWSQNLGHSSMLTTLNSYGSLTPYEQAEVIVRIEARSAATDDDLEELALRIARIAKGRAK